MNAQRNLVLLIAKRNAYLWYVIRKCEKNLLFSISCVLAVNVRTILTFKRSFSVKEVILSQFAKVLFV